MPDVNLTRLSLAVLIQAPFAFRLGYATRDGRELLTGSLLLLAGSVTAAAACFLTGSLLIGVGAALAAALFLSHARFRAAHRPPSAAASPPVPAPAAAVPSAPPGGAPVPPSAPDPRPADSRLLTGLAFVSEVLLAADRIGELRHRKRLRRFERVQAKRQAQGSPPPGQSPRSLRVRPRRDPPPLFPKK